MLGGWHECIEADGWKIENDLKELAILLVIVIKMPITDHMLQILWLVVGMENNKVNDHFIQI